MDLRKKKSLKKQEGFTLIELMVVIALMTIIYSITLSDYAGLNKNVELQNTVYDIALSIRETQLYGINKKLVSNEFSDGNPYPFGFHIDMSDDDTKQKIWVFSDFKNNGVIGSSDGKFEDDCNESDPKECQRISLLPKGNKIFYIKIKKSDGSWETYSDEKWNIIFKRPNPDAAIIKNGVPGIKYSSVCIRIASKDEIYKGAILVGAAGDVSIKKMCPGDIN